MPFQKRIFAWNDVACQLLFIRFKKCSRIYWTAFMLINAYYRIGNELFNDLTRNKRWQECDRVRVDNNCTLASLHWLPVSQRIEYKVFISVYTVDARSYTGLHQWLFQPRQSFPFLVPYLDRCTNLPSQDISQLLFTTSPAPYEC